jgi:hypothetical protein
MEFKNLNSAIDRYIGMFCPEKVREDIIEAAKLDFSKLDDVTSLKSNPFDKEWIIATYNKIFNKNCRVVSDAVAKKYKKIFENFQKAEIESAMLAAKSDEFHISNKFKYCTIEYFSRIDQIDKWLNVGISNFEKENGFVLPKFNIKA